MTSSNIAKSGLLYRQTSFLKTWKRVFVELDLSGSLTYYDNDRCSAAKRTTFLPTDCLSVKTGEEISGNIQPPAGLNREFLLQVRTVSKTILFCAESLDDMRAWQFSLEQARVLRHNLPPPPNYGPGMQVVHIDGPNMHQFSRYPFRQTSVVHTTYPYQVAYGGVAPQGQTTIIYRDQPYYRGGGYLGAGATGLLTGVALGSLFMWPHHGWY